MLSESAKRLIQSCIDDPILGERYRQLHGTNVYPPPRRVSEGDAGLPDAPSLARAVDAGLPKVTNVDESLPSARWAPPAVDESLPKVTKGDQKLPQSRIGKTKPFRAVDAGLPKVTKVNESLPGARSAPPAVDQGLPKATKGDQKLPESRTGKTKPFRPLRPRQLAAARLLVAGRTVSEVAAELRVSRQTIWKWTKHPAFTLALASVHRELCRDLQSRA